MPKLAINTFRMLITALIIAWSCPANAFEQTYETCSLTTWDLLKIADFYESKVPIEAAIAQSSKTENSISDIKQLYSHAEKSGIGEARLAVLQNYMLCMKDVKSGTSQSAFATKEPPYYQCGQSAAMNFMVLFELRKGENPEKLKEKLPEPFHGKIELFSKLSKDFSIDYAINSASKNASECIEAERPFENNSAYKAP